MSYEKMIQDTDQLIRGVLLREQIGEIILLVLAAILAGLVVWRWVLVRRAARECERLAEYTMGMAREKGLSGPWVPVVGDDVQVIDGIEFRRMLPPERMLEEDDEWTN